MSKIRLAISSIEALSFSIRAFCVFTAIAIAFNDASVLEGVLPFRPKQDWHELPLCGVDACSFCGRDPAVEADAFVLHCCDVDLFLCFCI